MVSQALFDHVCAAVAEVEARAAAVRAELVQAGPGGLSSTRLLALLGDDEGGVGDAVNAVWSPAHWDGSV